MTKRITLQAGDWVKLSDIPNEQVFNLVKGCFINAGFTDLGSYAQWNNRSCHIAVRLGGHSTKNLIQFTKGERQVSLSDVFNSINGGMNWYGCNYLHICKNGLVCYSEGETLELILNGVDVEGYKPVITIKRIQTSSEAPEAIIPLKVSQWWDYENGCAVGLPEKGELVLYQDYRKGLITVEVLGVCLKEEVIWTKGFFGDGNSFSTDSKESFKPADWDKTPKQILLDKALHLAAQNMSFEVFIERLYEAGLLKGGE